MVVSWISRHLFNNIPSKQQHPLRSDMVRTASTVSQASASFSFDPIFATHGSRLSLNEGAHTHNKPTFLNSFFLPFFDHRERAGSPEFWGVFDTTTRSHEQYTLFPTLV